MKFFGKKQDEPLPPDAQQNEASTSGPAPAMPIRDGEGSADVVFDEEAKAFVMVVLRLLHKNGFQSFGKDFYLEGDWDELVEDMEGLGFTPHLEAVVMDDWRRALTLDAAADPKDFGLWFVATFHATKIEPVAPHTVRERNKKLLVAYRQVVETIKRIQGYLDDVELRKRVETLEDAAPIGKATVCQCATRFCSIGILCDRMGQYSLVYSVDDGLQVKVSEVFASLLLRRIYEFTPDEMEPFVRIDSLYADCSKLFDASADSLPNNTARLVVQHMSR